MNKKETLLQLRQIYIDLLRAYTNERKKSNEQGIVSQREHCLGATFDHVKDAIDELEKLRR